MTLIAIKEGSKTIYRSVKDNELAKEYDPTAGKDLTTSGARLVSLGISEEKFEKIFGKHNSKS